MVEETSNREAIVKAFIEGEGGDRFLPHHVRAVVDMVITFISLFSLAILCMGILSCFSLIFAIAPIDLPDMFSRLNEINSSVSAISMLRV